MLKYNFFNLAGEGGCDSVIREELALAGILERKLPMNAVASGEVPFTLYGRDYFKGTEITYERAWRYWVVKCKVSLDDAKEFHIEYKEHDEDVRPMGVEDFDSGIKLPEWYSKKTGKRLMKQSEYDEFNVEGSVIKGTIEEMLRKDWELSDNFERDGEAFITTYHIDSLLGLKRFSDFVKEV